MKRHAALNRIYRLVWSQVLNAWLAVAETTRGKGKAGRSAGRATRSTRLAATALSLLNLLPLAHAAPTGGAVVAGSGAVSQAGSTTTVTQGSATLSVNWATFNVAANETVNFVQPSVSALAVNRIYDANGSQILGRINANGQLFLINPNGILFGAGAQVNVGGLVASTLDLSADSLAGNTRVFKGSGTGKVENLGTITATPGGYVAFLGNQVSNQGVITAKLGTVALGGGSAATLTFDGNTLLKLQIDASVLDSLADNGGLIRADGGSVLMSAGAADSLLASVVNNTGIIEARTVDQQPGTIVLLGGMAAGTTNVGGTLDASAPNGGNGGFIETSAAHVTVAEGARVTTLAANGLTGRWLIDPTDFTVAASGGDMTGAAVTAALALNNFEIESANGHSTAVDASGGNININDAVSWSANTLTLTAANNINLNAALNGSGSAGLALRYGQRALAYGNASTYTVKAAVNLASTGSFSTKLGSDGAVRNYTILTSLGGENSTTKTDLQGINGDLAGNYVLGANIDASATSNWSGGFTPIGTDSAAFSSTFDGLGHSVSGLTIVRPTTDSVGLFGYTGAASVIRNVGLVNATVSGYGWVGGLVGQNNGSVTASYAAGSVSGKNFVGGLVGINNGSISGSYATGSVSGSSFVGGLVGQNSRSIDASYATEVVSASYGVGGLVGGNSGSIDASYATGSASGTDNVGGLVGDNSNTITASYATTSVSGTNYVGGLVGKNSGTVTDSYWDIGSTGQSTSAGGTGLTTADMHDWTKYIGFTFTTTPGATGNAWFMVDGGTPLLAAEYSTAIHNAHQLQLMAMDLSAHYTLTADIDAAATGKATDVWGSAGFAPLGASAAKFTGSFDGLGHTVSGLTIDRLGTDYVGLFGYTAAASAIRNVGLVDAAVSGGFYVGALVGANSGTVSASYATGSVSGTDRVGGLVGLNSGTISTSYATGKVSGWSNLGGLVGMNNGSVTDSYASGKVSGTTVVGGLVGYNVGSVTASYWDIDSTGQANSAGGAGLTSTAMKQAASFVGWSTSLWKFYDGLAAPLLKSFLTPLTVTAVSGGRAYDGTTAGLGVSYSTTPDANKLLGSATVVASGKDVGVQALTATGLYSNQQGYDISYVSGTLAITPATLTVSGTTVADKTYDGNTAATLAGGTLSGVIAGETVTLSQSGAFASANAGSAIAVTASDRLSGAGASNYTLTQPTGLTGNIVAPTPAPTPTPTPAPTPAPTPTPTPTPASVAAEALAALAAGALLQQDTQYTALASARGAAVPASTPDAPRDQDAAPATSAPLLASSPAAAQLNGLQLRVIDGGIRLPAAVAVGN